ncbi:MAG TPA: PQQ-binding-like beta-propeller repeat protein [bacterium]|nr:PQQ-binding-like beta-propeller repeat protein [bacterium]
MFHSRVCPSLSVVVVFSIVLLATVALAEAPWAMVGANSARTNQSSFQGPGAEISLLWRVPTEHEGALYATVAEDGTVFALDHKLCAYDRDGRLSFQEDLGPAYCYGTEVGLICGDRVYAGLVNTLRTFNVSGAKIGEYTIPDLSDDYYFLTPAIGPAGEIILPMRKGDDSIGAPGAIARISPEGTLCWMFELGGLNLLFPPAVSRDGGIIVCVADLNDIWAAELPTSLLCFEANGTLRWRNDNMALGFPVVDDGNGQVIVRPSLEHREPSIIAFDLQTGELVWERLQGDQYSYDEGINDGMGWPLALDSQRGICYAFWDNTSAENRSQILSAVTTDGAFLWSNEWADSRDRSYDLPNHPIIDADELVYVFYSRTEYEQGVPQRVVCCSDVFDMRGALVSHKEYGAGPTNLSWAGCEPAIGPDNRIYMFAQDFDNPVTCCLYAFGPGSEPPPEYWPTILSAGYGLSNVTDADGGLLTINAEVYHPLGTSKIASVEVLLNGQPTGLVLLPNGTDGEYSLNTEVSPGFLSAGRFLLELVATDTEGKVSDTWPYFTVGRSSVQTP